MASGECGVAPLCPLPSWRPWPFDLLTFCLRCLYGRLAVENQAVSSIEIRGAYVDHKEPLLIDFSGA